MLPIKPIPCAERLRLLDIATNAVQNHADLSSTLAARLNTLAREEFDLQCAAVSRAQVDFHRAVAELRQHESEHGCRPMESR